jgi:hypothetical protein
MASAATKHFNALKSLFYQEAANFTKVSIVFRDMSRMHSNPNGIEISLSLSKEG